MNALSEVTKFTENILTSAKKQAQEIISQAERERERLLEEARGTISKDASNIVRNAQAEAEAIKRREVSKGRHRVKLREQLERDKILTDVIEETKRRVVEITKDQSKYFPYLVRLASDAIRQIDITNVTVHLNREDLKKVDLTKLVLKITNNLQTPARVEIAKAPIAASGGVVVSSLDGKIRIVNTFEQKFEALEPKLLIEAGRLLFGNEN